VTIVSDKFLVNLGCGDPGSGNIPRYFALWRQIRVDLDPAVNPDIVADATDLAPIAAGTADAVWMAHCLEHLHIHQVPQALAEIRRVLKDRGFACIIVPDLQRIAGYIAEDRMHDPIYQAPAGPITPHDIVFGYGPAIARGQSTMAHRSGFTPTTLMRHLDDAGFGGYALLRRANFELAMVAQKAAWTEPAQRDALLMALEL